MSTFEYLEKRRSQIDRRILAGYSKDEDWARYLEPQDRGVHTYVCGVSGSGKTRFLQNLLMQDMSKGQPFCLIDPTRALYQGILEFLAAGIDSAEVAGFDREDLLPRYHFLDLGDPQNPLRINPLEPNNFESTEQQVDDVLRVVERTFGSIDEMRRIRNVLRSALWIGVELNRLSPAEQIALHGQEYPLNLNFVVDFLGRSSDERRQIVEAIPDSDHNRYARRYWLRFFAKYSQSQQMERIESTWNILQYFVGDEAASRFFDTRASTLSISAVLASGVSLVCALPTERSLKGSQIVGAYLATKLQQAAYRREENQRHQPYYLYFDEFHEFVDMEFARASATLRQYGLRLVCAHQSQSQPPFHTPEGQALLQTIKGNSRIKVLFRLDRPDAEAMAKEVFEMSHRQLNFTETERTRGRSFTESESLAFSFQITEGTARTWSRTRTRSLGETATLGIGLTRGTNIGRTLAQSLGGSIAHGLTETINESESEGVTEAYSKQHGLTLAVGENWGVAIDHKRSFGIAVGENESFGFQTNNGVNFSVSDQESETTTRGTSSQQTMTDGEGMVVAESGPSGAYSGHGFDRLSRSQKQTSSLAQMHGEQASQAFGRVRGLSQGMQQSTGERTTHGTKRDVSVTKSDGSTFSRGRSHQLSRSEGETETEGRNRSASRGRSEAESRTTSESWQEALSETFTELEQISRTCSRALQESVSTGLSEGVSTHRDQASGQSSTKTESRQVSESETERRVYLSLEQEREQMVNRLQKLSPQQCFVCVEPLAAELLVAPFVEDDYYLYQRENLPRAILESQRGRLLAPMGADQSAFVLHTIEQEEEVQSKSTLDPNDVGGSLLVEDMVREAGVLEEDEDGSGWGF